MSTLKLTFTAAVLAAATLGGCAQTTGRVPTTATEVAVATGQNAYRATDSGTVYVYDRTHDKICYSGPINAGQFVTVDTRSNRILVDNRPVVENIILDNDAQYSIYLDHPRTAGVVHKTYIGDSGYERKTYVTETPGVERKTYVTETPTVTRRTVVEEKRPVEGQRTVIERDTYGH